MKTKQSEEIGVNHTSTAAKSRCESLTIDSIGSIMAQTAGAAELLNAAGSALTGEPLDRLVTFFDPATGEEIPGFLARLIFGEEFGDSGQVSFHPADRCECVCNVTGIKHHLVSEREPQVTLVFEPADVRSIEFTEDQSLIEAAARMSQVGAWDLDRETGRVRWTAQTFRIHELEPGDTPQLDEALSFYPSEHRVILEAAIGRAMEFGEPYDLELQIVTAKGNRRHVQTICRPTVVDGRTIKLQGTFQDITERVETAAALRESEALYRDIFEKNSAIKLLIDPVTQRIVEANTAALNFYGYSDEEIRQLRISDINTAGELSVAQKLQEVSEQDTSEFEFRHLLASGDIRDVQVHASTVSINQRTLVHSIVFDITERKRAEESLYRMQQLESLGTLAGGIAHDFNNVLTVIFGNVSIARDRLPTEHPAAAFLGKAEQAIERATGLSRQLLTFAKGGAPICENVSLRQLMIEVISFDLSGSNVCADIALDEQLWEVHVDRAQLQQMFSNLTVNADQAMPDGGVLHVAARNAKLASSEIPGLAQGKYVVVTFRDEGSGIRSEDVKRIFEPYFSTKPNGTGIGLATCYSIVKKHNGYIDAVSQLGVGTTFTIFLPVTTTDGAADESPKEPLAKSQSTKRRILALDDDAPILDVLTQMLSVTGATVETCLETDAAVAAYRSAFESGQPYDVVILDLTIRGGLGGIDAARRILSIDPDANVLCSSGYTEDLVLSEFKKHGFIGVIPKPYTSAELYRVVDAIPLRNLAVGDERSDSLASE